MIKNNNNLSLENVHEHFAFYGTLRNGHGNNEWMVAPAPGTKYEGPRVLSGYKMFDMGGKSYPFVVKTKKEEDTIVVELFYLPSKEAQRRIHWMELSSGYHVDEITLDGKMYWLYAKGDNAGSGFQPVPYGDWTKYKKGLTT